MTRNSLDKAVSELQKCNCVGSISWSTLALHLVRLLKLYSSGLSLPIVIDHLISYQHKESPCTQILEAKIVAVIQSPPVWLISFLDNPNHVHAHIPDSSFRHVSLPIGTRLTISLEHSFQNVSCRTAAETDALNAVQVRIHSDRKSDKLHTSVPTSLSFSSRSKILFHLDSFPRKKLPLSSSLESFTLQRVWNERSLYPEAVYASIVDTTLNPLSVRLQDINPKDSSQPSVECHFSPHFIPFIQQFLPGQKLLLLSPIVHPTETTFSLTLSDDSVCFHSQGADISSDEAHQDSKNADGGAEQRPSKRLCVKKDSYSNDRLSPLDASSLVNRQYSSNQKLVVHGRLTRRPTVSTVLPSISGNLQFNCEPVQITVMQTVHTQDDYCVGDEVLFSGVQWNDGFFFAEDAANLSTMNAILLAPFMINFVNGIEVSSRINSRAPSSTAHVCVFIRSVRVLENVKDIRLTVQDSTSPPHEDWEISVSSRCLDVLFHVEDTDIFWGFDNVSVNRVIFKTENDLQCGLWRMTLTCNGSISLTPQLCACVRVPIT